MKLRFRKGAFIFENPIPSRCVKLRNDPAWTALGGDCFETRSLRAVAPFRHLADESTAKILKRTFQERYPLPVLPPLPALDPHQRAGLEWILTRKRSYLAHAPGAGKTAQAILAALLSLGHGRCLFIVPPGLTANWEREIRKVLDWTDSGWISVGVVGDSAHKDDVAWRSDFILCPDSMLTKDWVYSRLSAEAWNVIAVDEASRFKDPFADRSLGFYGGRKEDRSYAGIFRDARHVVFMDGSPMPNRPMELWAPTFALDPESIDCMDQNDFGYRYCGARPNERGQWEFLYSSNEKELQGKLRASFMHVVTEGGLSHPERRRSMLFMDTDVRSAEQKTWERRHLTQVLDEGISDAGRGEVAAFRRELGIRKVPFITRYVAERVREKNESILLFVWHREVAEKISEEFSCGGLARYGVIYGGTIQCLRDSYIEQFQKGELKLLILNIAAAGRGYNLQRADRVIFGEFAWTDETNKQAEKRASRRGNEKAFTRCEYIVAPGSMDERVLNSIFTKQKRVERIIG